MKLNINTDTKIKVYFYNDGKLKEGSVEASIHLQNEMKVDNQSGYGDGGGIEINLVVYGRTATEALNVVKETLSKYGLAENIVYSQEEVDYIDSKIEGSWRV